MTDDISNYTFDFEQEAKELRRSLGPKADNTLFVDVDVDVIDSGGILPEVCMQYAVAGGQLSERDVSKAFDRICSIYKRQPDEASADIPVFEEYPLESNPRVHAVAIRKNHPSVVAFGEENKSRLTLFIFYHETGHTLVPGPRGDKDHPFQECAGDAYAALRFLQRFGPAAEPFISMVSWFRAKNAIAGGTSHLTTTVLDRIVADSASRDFSGLTVGETIELARTYAVDWTPEASVLPAMRDVFAPVTGGDIINLPLFYDTCLASSNDFAFYIGAKYFQPFLQPEGIVQNDKTFRLSGEDRQKYVALIEERAAGLSLSEIFNKVAPRPAGEPPLAELLKVSLPAGQKRFTFKT